MTTQETTKKITEFRLYPTTEQAAKIDLWLAQLKWVWNNGLSLLEEDQQRFWRVKQEWIEPSPEAWQWRKSCKNDGIEYVNPDNRYGLCCAYYPDRCDIRKHQDIEDAFKHVKNDLFTADKRCPDFLQAIDRQSRRSVTDSLLDAWAQYRKGKKRRPRYKKKADKLKSFSNGNGRIYVNISPLGNDNALIDYPKLGQIKCKGFYRRYAGNHTIVRIIKRADGYYVQFTSTVDVKLVKTAKKSEVGLDFGVIAPIADSDGRLHKSKRYAKLQAKKLARIQRSISRSKDGSNRLKAKRSKLAKVHLKIARQRDRFIHKLASKYVSEYQCIAIEDTKVKQMTGKAKPKPDGKGGYLPNGAAAKAGLNKALLDVAIGKTKTMLETKSKASERIFVKVPAPHTSQGCSQCGYYSEKFRPSQAVFKCLNCGHSDNADNNASTVIRNVAFKGLVLKPYSASSEEVKDVDRSTNGKKRQPKARKGKGSGAERTPAINRESDVVKCPNTLQNFVCWQDLKPTFPTVGSQLGFWDLDNAST